MRNNPTPAIVASFILTAFALTPTGARAAEQAAAARPAVQLVRPGDSQMGCQALSDEINQLAAAEQAPVAEAPVRKKKSGLGFLKVLTGAVPVLGMVGGAGGMLLSSAASAAQQGAGQGMADDVMADSRAAMQRALAGPSVASQRKDRLTEMFQQKGC